LPEWLVEHGFGETRAALIHGGEIVEARIELGGIWRAGSIIHAQLVSAASNGRNAIARDREGVEFLLPRGADGVTEGAELNIAIKREAIPGAESWKRPLATVAERGPLKIPPLAERLGVQELPVPRAVDNLARAGWFDLLDEARTGTVSFAGGELRISPTPAMTLIDVDGYLPPEELAVRGAAEAARTIRRLDIGGSIGIDLPTTGGKDARQAAGAVIDEVLPQPFERTAVNGFGFVQIVRRRQHASIVELALDRPAFEARALLRRVAFEPPGPKRLVAHPDVTTSLSLNRAWLDHLERAVGGAVGLRADAALPMSGGYAEPA
jgi:ribonuclease G